MARLQDLADRAGELVRGSARAAASAGRTAAQKITPEPRRPSKTPVDRRLDSLVARLARLDQQVPGGSETRERLDACRLVLREIVEVAGSRARDRRASDLPALDSMHPAAGTARRVLATVERGADAALCDLLRHTVAGLLHPVREVRLAALETLGEHPDPAILPLLATLHETADARDQRAIRSVVCKLEELFRSGPAMEPLLAYRDADLRSTDTGELAATRSRLPAAGDLGFVTGKRRIDWQMPPAGTDLCARLEEALRDRDVLARRQAARDVAGARDPSVVLPLMRALVDADLEVRREAAGAIARLTGADLPFNPEAPEPERQQAVSALRKWWGAARFEHLVPEAAADGTPRGKETAPAGPAAAPGAEPPVTSPTINKKE